MSTPKQKRVSTRIKNKLPVMNPVAREVAKKPRLGQPCKADAVNYFVENRDLVLQGYGEPPMLGTHSPPADYPLDAKRNRHD